MAGYSGTPLVQKLGIKENSRVLLDNAPAGFKETLGEAPPGTIWHARLPSKGALDVILCFVDRRSVLAKRFGILAKRLTPAGGLWVAWPKRASGVATDLSENVVREIGLASGLVDNKICAVDDTWSALRFVIRVEDRPKLSRH